MQAIMDANTGDAIGYGQDPWSAGAVEALKQLTGARGEAYLVMNGTGANVLGLGILLGRHEAVICPASAHIYTDEGASPERILGAKLLPVPTADGKLTPDLIAPRLAARGVEHFAQPAVVSLTQATEYGTCYTLAELEAIYSYCSANGVRVYMDGARIANAAAHLGCTLADMAQYADVLSFGGTKNGAMGVEAVVVMDSATTASAPYLRKQNGQLSSKMRYLGAQLGALLSDDLWRQNAARANAMATRLADGLASIPGVSLLYPVEADILFARLSPGHIAALQKDWTFYVEDEAGRVARWVTAFDASESDVDDFLAAIAATADA
jgi:threonine aldolase